MMGDIVQAIRALAPGDSIEISYLTLREYKVEGSEYPLADWLLAFVTGQFTSKEYWWIENELSKDIKFGRLIDPIPAYSDRLTWVHSHWKDVYEETELGYWIPK